ncbi:MAG: DUF2341 domain-containing protein [Fibrobacteres bacterium]|nr:DUF2341 domain-containing protein [Fibrobacterota bacterium]
MFHTGRLCLLSVLIASVPAIADDYSAWAHQKDIYFDTSPDGAGVSADVVSFPVLVRLTAADFPFAQARGSGQDIRFSKPDGTALPFEIDTYDSAAGTAALWVLADTVKGNSKGTLLRLHWGNPSAAAASEPGKVFSHSNGFAAVWHLGGRYQTARPNAVPGGMEAVAGNYDADEQTRGVIGFADSLDGGNPGDFLQTWQPFDSVSREFTFSVWANPASTAPGARFMDFGNGAGKDNVYLSRSNGGDSLHFEIWNGSHASSVTTPGGTLVLGEWQLFAVTVSGKTARIYRNGAEIAAGDLDDTIPALTRGSNFLGRSNWAADAYYQGMLDEPEVSAATRTPDWIKLAYANQQPGQTLLSFAPPVLCDIRFLVPADTSLPEGSALRLSATADCADQFQWSWVDGLPLRLLDPEVKSLSLALPRVTADTAMVLRFSAHFRDSARSRDVRIAIRNVAPDPLFTMPADKAWNGRDSMLIRPVITNLSLIQASPFPDLHAVWTLEGVQVDTASGADEGLWLFSPQAQGDLKVSLCLDNGGPAECGSMTVTVAEPSALGASGAGKLAQGERAGYDVEGRFRRDAFRAGPRFAPTRGSSQARTESHR